LVALSLSRGNPRIIRLGGCAKLRKAGSLRSQVRGLRDGPIVVMIESRKQWFLWYRTSPTPKMARIAGS
jgi:hypothetical protein